MNPSRAELDRRAAYMRDYRKKHPELRKYYTQRMRVWREKRRITNGKL